MSVGTGWYSGSWAIRFKRNSYIRAIADRKTLLIFISVFLIAFIPRFLRLGTTIVADEQLWIQRSINFMQSILDLDLSGTRQSGHPGVTTMWLGSIFIGVKYLAYGYKDLGDFLFAAQLPIAIATSLAVALMYFMIREVFNEKIAILSCIMISLDVFYLALSRVIHVDALLASFMALSLLSFLIFMDRLESSRFLILSGVLASLAMVTKVSAVLLFPFIALLVFSCFVHAMITSPSVSKLLLIRKFIKIYSVWVIATFGVMFLVWPAMWEDPLVFLRLFTSKLVEHHDHGTFFMGSPVTNSGFLLYPMVILFRTTPVTLIFFIACVAFILVKLIKNRKLPHLGRLERNTVILLLYILLFMALVTLGSMESERYLLPVFPVFDIVAAVGLFVAFEALINNRCGRSGKSLSFSALVVLIFVLQLLPVIKVYPYYRSYYNPLAGGPDMAQKVIRVGVGEGMDLVANYLNEKKNPQSITVASEYDYLLRVYFKGKVKPLTIERYETNTFNEIDYLVVYISGLQRKNLRIPNKVLEYHERHEPEHTVIINGIKYAYIYKVEHSSKDKKSAGHYDLPP